MSLEDTIERIAFIIQGKSQLILINDQVSWGYVLHNFHISSYLQLLGVTLNQILRGILLWTANIFIDYYISNYFYWLIWDSLLFFLSI